MVQVESPAVPTTKGTWVGEHISQGMGRGQGIDGHGRKLRFSPESKGRATGRSSFKVSWGFGKVALCWRWTRGEGCASTRLSSHLSPSPNSF